MLWTNEGAQPELPLTVADAITAIKDELKHRQITDDDIWELVDSSMPVYYSEILYQWTNLSPDFTDTWQEDFVMTKETNIYSLMAVDIFNHNLARFTEALRIVRGEE